MFGKFGKALNKTKILIFYFSLVFIFCACVLHNTIISKILFSGVVFILLTSVFLLLKQMLYPSLCCPVGDKVSFSGTVDNLL